MARHYAQLNRCFEWLTTIFTTTRLFFSKHFWALCNTLPSIIPYMGSVWCYRNWIERRRNKDGTKLSRKFALASVILTSKRLSSRWCCKNTSRLAGVAGVDRVCNGKTNHDQRAIKRFVKKMGLTRRKLKKRTYDLLDCFCKKHC